MTTINDIIKIEEILLMIEDKCRIELTLKDSIRLMAFLEKIGKITDLYFLKQEEYYKLYGKDKIQEYHDRLVSEDLEMDIEPYKRFIDGLNESLSDNVIFKDIYLNRFW